VAGTSPATTAAAEAAAASSDAPVGRLEADPGVRFAFSDRALGNVSLAVGPQEDVAAARLRLAAAVGLEDVDLVFMEQVHGAGVAVVGLSDRARGLESRSPAVPGVDALVTTDPDVGLVVMVADCVPVILAVPRRGVAAIHAGRAGVASGIVGATVAVLAEEAGAAPADAVARIGPAVGGCCYEVPRALQVEVAASARAASATTRWGTPSLDLPAAVEEQLRAAGVRDVERVGGCTVCQAATSFSHRASTNAGAPEGRQAGVVRMGARSASGASAGPGAARMGARPPESADRRSLDSR
jgi:polyphenol oxidase